MRPLVVLYDIDGTLISTGGAGRRALERTFAEAFGRPGNFDFPFGGMTDRAIIRGGLRATGLDDDDESIEFVMRSYTDVLVDEIATTERYVVHPGVWESLDALAAFDDVAIGLGTGNVEVGARIKLERAGLNESFAFGGFGCDDEDRALLIAAGARRGADRLGAPIDECRLIIIGDTPKDVAAAHANRGECVAVATGGSTRAALEESRPRWVFDDLAGIDWPELLELRL